MKELSIFVDESGDFGEYAKHSPYYIITMVLHDQKDSLVDNISKLKSELSSLGYENDFVVHTGPLIRKEEIYCDMLPNDRRAILTKLFFFTLRSPIKYKSFVFKKKEHADSFKMEAKMARELSLFLRTNLNYFLEYDKVILYYDNGQKQITRMLNSVFATELQHYDIRRVLPKDYTLFQAADLICTLELLNAKCNNGENLTRSEQVVFHTNRELFKQFIRPIRKKVFE